MDTFSEGVLNRCIHTVASLHTFLTFKDTSLQFNCAGADRFAVVTVNSLITH